MTFFETASAAMVGCLSALITMNLARAAFLPFLIRKRDEHVGNRATQRGPLGDP